MGYDIHITREACWLDDENPITLDEVREILPVEPHQFRIDETGEVLIATPQGNAMIAGLWAIFGVHRRGGKKRPFWSLRRVSARFLRTGIAGSFWRCGIWRRR